MDGSIVRLSRQEHALLLRFVRNPHILITRSELLEALGNGNGTLSERNIDYLVNRLRKRLGDTARESRFIETRYGDGYVWVAEPVKPKPLSAFLMIGPVYETIEGQGYAIDFPKRLASTIKNALDGKQDILVCPDWRPDPNIRDRFDFTLEVSLHVDRGVKHLALVLRDGKSRKVIDKFRRECAIEEIRECVEGLSQQILYALWRHAILDEPGAEATVMRADGADEWHENAARMHHIRAMENAGPESSVMLALTKYGRLINSIHHPPMSQDEWVSLENGIENLSLRALPDAHGNPHILLAIAKILRFIDRGYLDLSSRLADEAFHSSTTFVQVFAMKGQIEASRGNLDAAISYYDNALAMVEPTSHAHVYLLILKVIAWIAGGNRGAAYHTVLELHSVAPVDRNLFGLILIPPDAKQLCASAENMLAALTPVAGQNLTRYLFRVWARQFQLKEHRRNILHGLAYHLQRHHGNSVISMEVSESFPKLLMREI